MQLAPEDESHPHAGSDREEGEIVDAARDAEPALAERREIDVVLELDVEVEPVAELGPEGAALETGDVRRQTQRSARRFDDAWNSDDCAVDQVAGDLARLDQRLVQRADRIQRAFRVRSAYLHVLP